MKAISSLVKDIYDLVQNPPDSLDPALTEDFGKRLAQTVAGKLSRSGRQPPRLRVSNLGDKCDRRLWYSVNHPELAEPLSAATRIKFLFGDILELLLLFLAKAAGHTVENEQAEISINGVKGHIDGTIDRALVDCKSASTYSFAKFRDHGLESDDAFGYLTQLGAYGSQVGEGNNHFLAIDKQHGHVVLDSWPKAKEDFGALVARKRSVLSSSAPPERGFHDEPFQASGNRKLGVSCSYCPFKFHCWPGLRTFYYSNHGSNRPVFLSKVVREPRVKENAVQI